MQYVIDSDVFIQAKNLHYGFDFCPAFWDWIEAANSGGSVYSVEKIAQELGAGNDDLAAWAAARGPTFFKPPDAAVLATFPLVSAWANAGGFTPAAVATFLASGEYYLISHALAYQCTVVSHEVSANTSNRIKVPNACAGVGVQCLTPFRMLRAEGASFVLGAAAQPAIAGGASAGASPAGGGLGVVPAHANP